MSVDHYKRIRREEEKRKLGLMPAGKYSSYTTDDQVKETRINHDYSMFGGSGKSYTQVLKDQVVKTGNLHLVFTDFTLKTNDFEVAKDGAWDWVTKTISTTVQNVLVDQNVGVSLNFGMKIVKPKDADRKDPSRFLMVKADSSPSGYFINDWFEVYPTVKLATDELRRILKTIKKYYIGRQTLHFTVTITKPIIDSGTAVIPFEMDRDKIVTGARKIKRESEASSV